MRFWATGSGCDWPECITGVKSLKLVLRHDQPDFDHCSHLWAASQRSSGEGPPDHCDFLEAILASNVTFPVIFCCQDNWLVDWTLMTSTGTWQSSLMADHPITSKVNLGSYWKILICGLDDYGGVTIPFWASPVTTRSDVGLLLKALLPSMTAFWLQDLLPVVAKPAGCCAISASSTGLSCRFSCLLKKVPMTLF